MFPLLSLIATWRPSLSGNASSACKFASTSFAESPCRNNSSPRGPYPTFTSACVAIAPTAASAHGTTATTEKYRDATATPQSPFTGSYPTMENVLTPAAWSGNAPNSTAATRTARQPLRPMPQRFRMRLDVFRTRPDVFRLSRDRKGAAGRNATPEFHRDQLYNRRMPRACLPLLLLIFARCFAFQAPSPPSSNHLADPFVTGWMLVDTNADGIADFINGKVVVPASPRAAENAAAANLAARQPMAPPDSHLPS